MACCVCEQKKSHEQKHQKAEHPRTKPLRDSAMIAAICCSENVFAGIEAIKSFTAPPPQNSIKIWKTRS